VSHARDLLTELLAVLRADLGTLDLSTVASTPRVVIADGGPPPCSPPYLLITAPSLRVTYARAPMGEYGVEGRLEWWLMVPSALDTVESRAFAALDGASEVIAAIQSGHADSTRTTLYTTQQLLPSLLDVFGDAPDMAPGLGIAHGELVYTAILTRGA